MTILLRQKPLPQVVRQIVQRDNGAWFDPEDMSTMYQDAAGTTPVTALEQPVGLWLDKSGNGNHATQSITASRPTLSARYNWLLNSATLSTQPVTTVAAQYTLSFTGTGSVTLSGTATGTLVGTGVNNRVSLSFTPTAGTLTLTVTGSVTLAMLSFGTLTTYQEITTAISYDSVGWSRYVRFDGIDDYLNLPYMGLYANGSASVVLASSLLSNTTQSLLLSESSSVSSIPIYYLYRHLVTTGRSNSYIRNNSNIMMLDWSDTLTPTLGAIVINSIIDSGSTLQQYDNSSDYDIANYTRSGVLTVNKTTIGALVYTTTTSFFNGNITGSLIITKSALSDTDRRRCEQFIASRLSTLGVTLS